MVVVAVRLPEVPVMVTVAAPVVAVALAVSVSTLVLVVGLVANAAVTPVGRPDAARVTEPVNGLTSVTVIVSVPLALCAIDRVDAEGKRVKLPPDVTVREIVVVAVSVPEVPVIVTVDVPAVAAALAVRVSTLVLVAGLVAKAAVTPVGRPDAARVTEPVKGLTSVTVIVSVPLAPCATDNAVAEGFRVKLPPVEEGAPLVHVTPLSVKNAGGWLVMPFHVPLNPNWPMLPPAAMVPLKLALVTVTLAPVWVSVPSFQIDEIVCPLRKVHPSVQLLKAVDDVL